MKDPRRLDGTARLDQARREHGRRSEAARDAAAGYAELLRDRIRAEVVERSDEARRDWDRDGLPLWMRIKLALRRGRRA